MACTCTASISGHVRGRVMLLVTTSPSGLMLDTGRLSPATHSVGEQNILRNQLDSVVVRHKDTEHRRTSSRPLDLERSGKCLT